MYNYTCVPSLLNSGYTDNNSDVLAYDILVLDERDSYDSSYLGADGHVLGKIVIYSNDIVKIMPSYANDDKNEIRKKELLLLFASLVPRSKMKIVKDGNDLVLNSVNSYIKFSCIYDKIKFSSAIDDIEIFRVEDQRRENEYVLKSAMYERKRTIKKERENEN
mgnify:CR=1 FL=1